MQASSSSSWQILHSTKTPLAGLPSWTDTSHAVDVVEGTAEASPMADWRLDSVSNRPAITAKWSAMDPRKIETTNRAPKHTNDDGCDQNGGGGGEEEGQRRQAGWRRRLATRDLDIWSTETPRERRREARDGVGASLALLVFACFWNILRSAMPDY